MFPPGSLLPLARTHMYASRMHVELSALPDSEREHVWVPLIRLFSGPSLTTSVFVFCCSHDGSSRRRRICQKREQEGTLCFSNGSFSSHFTLSRHIFSVLKSLNLSCLQLILIYYIILILRFVQFYIQYIKLFFPIYLSYIFCCIFALTSIVDCKLVI